MDFNNPWHHRGGRGSRTRGRPGNTRTHAICDRYRELYNAVPLRFRGAIVRQVMEEIAHPRQNEVEAGLPVHVLFVAQNGAEMTDDQAYRVVQSILRGLTPAERRAARQGNPQEAMQVGQRPQGMQPAANPQDGLDRLAGVGDQLVNEPIPAVPGPQGNWAMGGMWNGFVPFHQFAAGPQPNVMDLQEALGGPPAVAEPEIAPNGNEVDNLINNVDLDAFFGAPENEDQLPNGAEDEAWNEVLADLADQPPVNHQGGAWNGNQVAAWNEPLPPDGGAAAAAVAAGNGPEPAGINEGPPQGDFLDDGLLDQL